MIYKRFTKNLACILAAALFSAPLTACSEKSPETQENTPAQAAETTPVPDGDNTEEEGETYISDGLPESDFKGYGFRVLSCVFVGRELASFLMADEITGEPVNDALFETTTAVEDRFNAEFSYINVVNTDAVMEHVKSSVNAGTDDFDIQCGIDFGTANLSKQGMFYNMYDVPQYDFSKPWWPKNIVEQLDIAGKLFLGSSYLTFNGLHWTRVLIANKTLCDEYQIPIPYDTIMNGEWYWDDFAATLKDTARDLNNDGKMDDKDFYGFHLGGGVTYCMQDTFDIKLYRESEDGLELAVDQERADTFLQKMKAVIKDPMIGYVGEEFSSKIFQEERCIFGTTMIGTTYDEIRASEVSYCVLPFPKLDELQKDYINTCTDAFWCIPITAAGHIDIIGTLTEALSCENYQKVLPVYFETAIKVRLSESPEDAGMFDIIKDTRTIGFEYAYQTTFRNILQTCVVANDVGFASYYKRWEKSAARELNNLYETFVKMHQ